MSTVTNQRPAYYARLICEHMKSLSNFYTPDPEDVREALGLSEASFKAGLDWCIERQIIVMDSKSPVASASVEEQAMKGDSSRLSSMLRSPALAEAS